MLPMPKQMSRSEEVGVDCSCWPEVIGCRETDTANNNYEHLSDVCETNSLIVGKTQFSNKHIHQTASTFSTGPRPKQSQILHLVTRDSRLTWNPHFVHATPYRHLKLNNVSHRRYLAETHQLLYEKWRDRPTKSW
ncbi:unnamed protein product [Soboliphyme baturini]|uniref:Spondin domain-containing protein n=1 Tax=Soboliphyme baturini TaxID=241478 RepID=A0A183J3W0_9BILA|nr:unnamed protein product [Soboliphyme baturini]